MVTSNGQQLTDDQYQLGFRVLENMLLERSRLARRAGYAFGTDRDYYKILGYKESKELTFDVYRDYYERFDIAGTIVDKPAQDTWRNPPAVYDGTSKEDARTNTPFAQAWNDLVKRRRVFHYLSRADRLAGIGRYGVLLIGVRDGIEGERPMAEPVEANSLSGPEDVLYLSAFSEGSANIIELHDNPAEENFGRPEMYQIDFGGLIGGQQELLRLGKQTVHASRVIHIAEDLLDDDVFGRPRLKRVINRLDDLMKIVGGSAEATWKLMRKGFVFNIDPDKFQDLTQDAKDDMRDQLTNYDHGLQRYLRLMGMDVTELGSEVVDPKGLFEMILSLISGETGIPQRILLGSERGELASSQDEANWAGVVSGRQTDFAGPYVLHPFIDRLIFLGALPPPTSGSYFAGGAEGDIEEWPPLFELNELEQAQLRDRNALSYQRVVQSQFQGGDIIAEPDEVRTRILGWPEREVTANRGGFRTQQREEATPDADEADAAANALSEELQATYDEWLAEVSADLDEAETREQREAVIAAALVVLHNRIRARGRRALMDLAVTLDAGDAQLRAMERQLDESLRVFQSNTLGNIEQDVRAGALEDETTPQDEAGGRARDVALLGGILWSAFQASKFADRTDNPLVMWVGPVDDNTCEPCTFQMSQGARPVSQTPMPGPDICRGLTQCRHDLVEVTPR